MDVPNKLPFQKNMYYKSIGYISKNPKHIKISILLGISIALKCLRCHELNQDMWLITYKQIMFLQKKSLYLRKMVA